ncbi:MAG: DUF1311 domain-containing protein [Coriobacteriia bacterium]|nr:DUF1311 domain-containing protein [Coriobacteriia bacterium]
MKKAVIVCLVICLLFVAGCGKKTPASSSATQSTSSNATKSSANTTQKSEDAAASAVALAQRKSVALKALSDVLLNKSQFYSTDSKRELYLKSFKWSDTDYCAGANVAFRAVRFAAVDMDGDGVPEVVLDMEPAPNASVDPGYEVLHYTGSKVDGFNFHFRSMATVGRNGLYTEGDATNNYTEKLRFLGDACDSSYQYYSESADGTDNGKPVSFYFYDVPLTAHSYDAALDSIPYNQVDWHDYSGSLIAKWVTDRPASADPKPVISNSALLGRQNYLDGLAALAAFQPERVNPFAEYARDPLDYYQDWDKELNKIYSLLKKKLPASQMDALRKDEKQWINIRGKRGAQAYQNWMASPNGGNEADALYEKNRALGDVTKNRTLYLIDLYFGDTSQPSTTQIIQKYGLKK